MAFSQKIIISLKKLNLLYFEAYCVLLHFPYVQTFLKVLILSVPFSRSSGR